MRACSTALTLLPCDVLHPDHCLAKLYHTVYFNRPSTHALSVLTQWSGFLELLRQVQMQGFASMKMQEDMLNSHAEGLFALESLSASSRLPSQALERPSKLACQLANCKLQSL